MLGAQLVMGWAEDRAQSVANVKKNIFQRNLHHYRRNLSSVKNWW